MAALGWQAAPVRADRLVATLLLLQARGRVTAAEVAEELEVSERTARRDLEALGMAGIPVYSQSGRGGGWSLLGGARTDLSGLTAAEARTLFLVAGPSSAATPEAKSALRKLVQALPETFRADAEAAASAVMLDPSTWGGRPVTPPPFLEDLQRAVVDKVQVELGYTDREGNETKRQVSPLGLVQKGSTWYLVAHTDKGLRTFRVWRVRSVVPTGRPAERPDGFDLGRAWQDVVAAMDERRMAVTARLRVRPDMLRPLRSHWGTSLAVPEDVTVDPAGGVVPGADDDRARWPEVTIATSSWTRVAEELAGYGDAVEVLDPPEVRAHLADLGSRLVALYRADRRGEPMGGPGTAARRPTSEEP